MYCSCLFFNHFSREITPSSTSLTSRVTSALSFPNSEFSTWDRLLSLSSWFKGTEVPIQEYKNRQLLYECHQSLLVSMLVRSTLKATEVTFCKQERENWVRETDSDFSVTVWPGSDCYLENSQTCISMYFPLELSLFLQQCFLGITLQMRYLLVIFICFHFYLVLCHIWFLVYTQVYQDWDHFLFTVSWKLRIHKIWYTGNCQ